jgi:restriction system protein
MTIDLYTKLLAAVADGNRRLDDLVADHFSGLGFRVHTISETDAPEIRWQGALGKRVLIGLPDHPELDRYCHEYLRPFVDEGCITKLSKSEGYVITELGRDALSKKPVRFHFWSKINQHTSGYLPFNHFQSSEGEVLFFVRVGGTKEILKAKNLINSLRNNKLLILANDVEHVSYQLFAEYLLANVTRRGPTFFENLCVELLVRTGYGVSGKVVGRRGDKGVDGFLFDSDGKICSIIQAKLRASAVQSKDVREFIGNRYSNCESLRTMILITTGEFTRGAREEIKYARGPIKLIAREELVSKMIETKLGVFPEPSLLGLRLDLTYFYTV